MKRSIFRGVWYGLRSSTNPPTKGETEIEETLRPDHFRICKTVRHGFPFHPTAVAFDPVQHVLAIGNKTGSLRIIGRPGVDIHIQHEGEPAILQVLFLINEGALVTVCSDGTLHLWNFKEKKPEIFHSLKFQREKLSYCHLPFQSKWLYIGTKQGNVHIVNIESFVLSGYVINWNKAIEISRKTHPGPVVHLSDNPMDSNKLLIGFESGTAVMWDLRSKSVEHRYNFPQALSSIAWHFEGKQFMCSHADGSLTTWSVKTPQKPPSIMVPHAKVGADGKTDPCTPIPKVAWKSVRNGEDKVVFSGGMSYDRVGGTSSITVMTGKSTTVLEMEHEVVDFVILCDTPWSHDFQDPYAVVVLLENDLVVFDLNTPGYPCYENPYPMDLHESPVTACQYYANCPTDLIPAFYSVGSKQKKTGFSEKAWPIKGGQWGTTMVSYPEIFITGHADGCLKFWDASSVTLQILYKLKTVKIFDKTQRSVDSQDEDPFAIQIIYLCPESRMLCVAGASHVMLFRFCKQEVVLEVPCLELSIVSDIYDVLDSAEFENPTTPKPSLAVAPQQNSIGSNTSGPSDSAKMPEQMRRVKVRGGARMWAAGYQPDLVCVLCGVEGDPPGNITVVTLNSSYGLMAFGNESGLAIVDFVQKTCLLSLGTPDLYGSMDPYQRRPQSPRSRPLQSESISPGQEEGKSPTADPLPCVQRTISEALPPVPPPRPKHKRSKQLKAGEQTNPADGPDCQSTGPRTLAQMMSFEEVTDEGVFATDPPQPQTPTVQTDNTDSPLQGVPIPEIKKPELQVEEPPDPLLLTSEGCIGASPKCASTGNVNLDCLAMKTSLSQVLSETKEERHQFRRSQSDPSVKNQQHEKIQALPVSDGKKTSSPKRPTDIETKMKEAPAAPPEITLMRLSSVETAEEATFLDDQEKQGQVAQDAVDGTLADLKSPDWSDPPPQSRGFFHRMGHRLKSSLSGKPKQEGEESEEAKQWQDRVRLMKERKLEVVNLSDDTHQKKPSVRKMTVAEICSARKVEWNDSSSFSRSRSSSNSSLDNVTREAVQCLVFADSFTRKTDNLTCPCLWVGTSLGSVIVMCLSSPGLTGEQRAQQPIMVSPSGTIFRLKGAIVHMSFLDCNGVLIPSTSDQWKEASGDVGGRVGSSGNLLGQEKDARDASDDRALKTLAKPKISPSPSQEITDGQFVIICSEKQARVVLLPSQTCAYKVKITETSFVVRAEVVSFRDSVCLLCYIASGHIKAFSLPSLKPLCDEEFLPLTDYRVARTFRFSNSGHALYFCSPSEVQKITYSADIADNQGEMVGDVFLPRRTPVAPKQGFFKNLFGGGTSMLDREELFGEASGKASRAVAKHTAGHGGMQHLQQQAGAAGGEFARMQRAAKERGEKLGELDDSSAAVRREAEDYSQKAHQLMLKYRDRKWYQF